MNKHYLFKKASAIHAIKCYKTSDFDVAVTSFETLVRFKSFIQSSEELANIDNELDTWANQQPVATHNEILNLIRR